MKFKWFLIAALVFSACSSFPRKTTEYFVIDPDSPKIEAGSIDVQFDKYISLAGIRKEMVDVEYYPLEDAVCLQFRLYLQTYNQFWSKKGREAFLKALETYKEDYAAKNLQNNRKTKKQYGTVLGYLIWRMTQFTIRAKANMNMEIGYTFVEKSPYFVVYQREAEYIDHASRDNNRTSLPIMMYFTRAQADELAVLFDQDYLDVLAGKKAESYNSRRSGRVDREDY